MLRSSVVALACLLAFAAPAAADNATFTVTSNADTGGTCTTSCTLRQAINSANSDPAVDYIDLEPNLGTLTLTDALPLLSTEMVINGDNAGSDAPHLRIDGSGLVNHGAGLNVTAQNVVVRGLSITGFDSYGVRVVADWATLDHLLIGKTPAGDDAAGVMGAGIFVHADNTTIGNLDTTGGATATGNVIANTVADPINTDHKGDGIWVYAGTNNVVEGSVFSGNAGAGVRLRGAATVNANKIGTNFAGTAADANNDWGIQVEPGATGASVLDNVVSGNEVGGVLVQADDASVTGNVVGLTADASAKLGNAGNGIEVSSDNVDVGNATAPANTIGGNTAAGVLITSTGTAFVRGNLIGTNSSWATGLGNATFGVDMEGTGDVGDSNRGNVVAANGSDGVRVGTTTAGAVSVAKNHVGTDFFNQLDLGNTGAGIAVGPAGAGVAVGSNEVYANTGDGISTEGAGSFLVDNFVGNPALPNGGAGLRLLAGNVSATNNTIAGNAGSGIAIGAGADSGSAVGNQISGSGADGITVEAGSSGSVLGGNAITQAFNSFSDSNTGAGIRLLGSAEVRAMQMTGNGGPPIDAGAEGADDPSTRPVITWVDRNGGSVRIRGSVPGSGQATLRLYDTDAACGAGGTAEHYVGTKTVPAGAFDVTLTTAVKARVSVGATQSGASGELSPCADRRDIGTVAFVDAAVSAPEDGGPVTLTLERTGFTTGPATVHVVAGGGTATGGDYAPLDADVRFADGQSTATVQLAPTADANVEPDETVDVTLSAPDGAVLGAQRTATVTIANDDAAPPPPPAQHAPVAKIAKATAKAISGTAADADGDLVKVQVAVVQKTGKRCKVLTAKGTLKNAKCTVRTFLKANGTTAWTFKLKRKLQKGRYLVYARAIDAGGRSATAQRAFRLKR